MKKIFLLLVTMTSAVLMQAQVDDNRAAMQLVTKNSAEIGLSKDDLNNVIVSSSYLNRTAGTRMVYLQQSFKGIPVYNQLQVLAFKNDKLVSKTGSRIASIEKHVNTVTGVPAVSPQSAVVAALSDRKLVTAQIPAIINRGLSGQKIEFGDLGITRENVTAQLMWVPLKEGKKVQLAWQVYIIPKTTSDYWLVRVDAKNSGILGVDNLTVYCNWDSPDHNRDLCNSGQHKNAEISPIPDNLFSGKSGSGQKSVVSNSPSIVNSATYRVVPFPAESPIHPGGAHTLKTDPWLAAPGNATSLKWHSNGTTDYTSTRGNNVWAQEDRNNNNGTGLSAISTTSPDPLTFDFTPNYAVIPTQTTPVQNQQFNTTNLFYWNNIIHDITYQYGFDEVSGNFQANNQGRGGLGNDFVMADAQDGGGTNNANFSTPADGSSGRMQMYLWSGTPQKDGDVDNGIIVHEYGHGISNRLTGGPANSSCLSNAEQAGEGWSDYYALMYTQDWANSTLTSGFSSPRGIGTYAIGQSATGTGIRSQKYCTNFAINNQVYGNTISAQQHNRGEIWCATLWDMTWNIINQVGAINPNIYNATGVGGNSIALKLVTEGLRLQPCSPGFIDGRDAILQADQVLYAGAYSCAIREAFRRRGMGALASQGSSASTSDQVADFSGGSATLLLTQGGITSVPEGTNITYTNTLTTNSCGSIANFTLTDTLPANVTYVSGGTYNAATRVVSFPVNLAPAQTQTYSFTVNVNPGSYFPTVNLFEDQVPGPAIPATWTLASTTPTNWAISNARSHSAPNSYYSLNLDVQSDQKIFSTNAIALGATPPPLTFWHWYSAELTYDGGVLEISTNGGTTWTDVSPNFISGGYTGFMDASTLLNGRPAWTGSSNNAFIKTKVNLTPYANQNVKLRFRFTSDVGTNLEGWYIDDIAIKDQAVVEMRSNLFSNTGANIAISDTITIITQALTCTNVAITAQPANTNACAGGDAVFSVAVDGTTPGYQWQVSTNGGTNYTDIGGATMATLTLTGVTAALNNNLYRVIVTNACPSNITSAGALLSVSDPAAITSQPANATLCAGSNASFTVTATGTSNTYQWQVSTDGGTTFTDVTGANTSTLNLTAITPGMDGNQYHLVVTSCSPTGVISTNVTLTVNSPATITAQPVNITSCVGSDATFTATASGTAVTYQWQVSTNGGTTYTSIPAATSATLTLTAVTAAMNNNLYQVIVNGLCAPADTSAGALLTVSNTASITVQPTNMIACAGDNTSFTATASGTSYQWQVSTDAGLTFTDITGATTTTLDLVAVTASMNNYQYRLVVFSCGATGLNSTAVTLTVYNPAEITAQPNNTIVCIGADATFTVTASGTSVTYQWEVSVDGGITYTAITGETAATLVVPAVTVAMNNYFYRVVLSNSCTVSFTSNPAILSVTSVALINTQPADASTCSGTTASYSVAASGTGLTYQWQVSTDAGLNFTNIVGETGISLTLTGLTDAMNNNQYRVVVSNSCSSVGTTSDAATLTVYPLPTIEITASPYTSLSAGLSTTLTATSTPASSIFSWFKDSVLIPGVTGNTITVNYDELGEYSASVSDGNGCTKSSNLIKIADSSLNITFIYPNPNTGSFSVRFQGVPYNGQPRIITMYDSKGARVYSKSYNVSTSYEQMDVFVEKLSAGVYMLVLYDVQGKTLATGKVIIL